jgi:hypothetical protein
MSKDSDKVIYQSKLGQNFTTKARRTRRTRRPIKIATASRTVQKNNAKVLINYNKKLRVIKTNAAVLRVLRAFVVK